MTRLAMLRLRLALLAVLLAAQAAGAQQLQVGVAKGPHYVGTFIEIQVTATGFPGEPAPELDVPAPQRGRLDFVDFQTSSSQSISIVNDRMTRREEVTLTVVCDSRMERMLRCEGYCLSL